MIFPFCRTIYIVEFYYKVTIAWQMLASEIHTLRVDIPRANETR